MSISRFLRSPMRFMRVVSSRLLPARALLQDPLAYHCIANWTFGKRPRVDIKRVFPGVELNETILLKVLGGNSDVSVTVQELAVLCAIVRHLLVTNLLEVGTYDGRTALNLAANTGPGAYVTTLDLGPRPADNHDLALNVPPDLINATDVPETTLAYRGTPYASKVRQVYGDSAAVDWAALGAPFDLIFLDGCHYYDYVKSDTENALRSLRPGGVVIWHDYGVIEDVSRVVDETAARIRVEAIRSTSLAVGFVSVNAG